MGKKPKESKPETPNSPPSNSIFKTLFGITNIQEPNDPSSVSIFSDSNPFRTKPTNESQKLQQILQLDIDSPQKNHTQIPNSPNKLLSKRKRKDKQKIDQDDSDIESEVKKSKLENAVVSERLKRLVIDDEEKLLRTVFVGNLPLKVKKKALLKEFDRFGEIESVRIRSVPILDDKTPRKGAIIKKQINDAVDRVNAYIVFKTEDSAQASLSHNMAVVGGNHIHVDRACPPRKKFKGENAPLYDTKRTVFIGNLPFDVKDEELYQLFTGFSNLKDCIEAIRVVRDPGTSMGKGIAYVLFTTRDAANTVVRKHKLKIRDRELRLSHATKTNSNSTPSKRKEPSTPDNYGSSKKAAASGSTSYQGIRATKSGGQKKFATRVAKPGRSESGSEKTVKRKVRSEKRPAVAARKAAANAARTGGDGGSGGVKRKPENRTPQSSSRNKKPRRFR
ncbi:putative RNA recognition motif domain, nucleotide-binding alpha-beta plait domain superfamily [Helianthus annuus]|nr:putative RNA recognition motif domain, nucleotide-binding alpha-beta plait domain superfamily [Helianthus annuus]KAJ0496989.1 putative RNA recognition motif domain, nucleotide-binding alpha-beta plait domain superfamily [Helianthus annuus]KAJ0663020.1 putative RNA recognition motif domain, nucleotide-binding alpha-beta plait domain superfamily [Helianthus annuus]KAJ0670515.1 putative RNA recognition motif domain, nucleotide-binding alpha-beta plait domain superfamily [Helianthus annuus]